MISKEKMIKAIYEKIADKTLSFGCKIELLDGAIVEYITDVDDWWPWINENIDWEYWIYVYNHNRDSSIQFEWFGDICDSEKLKERFFNKHRYIKKVIWHPIMIGDILYYIDKYYKTHLWWDVNVNWEVITRNWNYLRKPIEKQSDDCITYVYNLIK